MDKELGNMIAIYRVIHFVVSKLNVNKTHIKYFFHDITFFYCKS